ncbi:hypothetical protein B0H19DRAFT_1228979 [Mycena capillaripes]|nr:hypothetical protein B0H19DRAFT_1228979 [Mycena capillaripes]
MVSLIYLLIFVVGGTRWEREEGEIDLEPGLNEPRKEEEIVKREEVESVPVPHSESLISPAGEKLTRVKRRKKRKSVLGRGRGARWECVSGSGGLGAAPCGVCCETGGAGDLPLFRGALYPTGVQFRPKQDRPRQRHGGGYARLRLRSCTSMLCPARSGGRGLKTRTAIRPPVEGRSTRDWNWDWGKGTGVGGSWGEDEEDGKVVGEGTAKEREPDETPTNAKTTTPTPTRIKEKEKTPMKETEKAKEKEKQRDVRLVTINEALLVFSRASPSTTTPSDADAGDKDKREDVRWEVSRAGADGDGAREAMYHALGKEMEFAEGGVRSRASMTSIPSTGTAGEDEAAILVDDSAEETKTNTEWGHCIRYFIIWEIGKQTGNG